MKRIIIGTIIALVVVLNALSAYAKPPCDMKRGGGCYGPPTISRGEAEAITKKLLSLGYGDAVVENYRSGTMIELPFATYAFSMAAQSAGMFFGSQRENAILHAQIRIRIKQDGKVEVATNVWRESESGRDVITYDKCVEEKTMEINNNSEAIARAIEESLMR